MKIVLLDIKRTILKTHVRNVMIVVEVNNFPTTRMLTAKMHKNLNRKYDIDEPRAKGKAIQLFRRRYNCLCLSKAFLGLGVTNLARLTDPANLSSPQLKGDAQIAENHISEILVFKISA